MQVNEIYSKSHPKEGFALDFCSISPCFFDLFLQPFKKVNDTYPYFTFQKMTLPKQIEIFCVHFAQFSALIFYMLNP